MNSPNALRRDATPARPLDATDRRILAALAQDAGRGYAALAAEAGLSPAATHERVKRLRASGRIAGVCARLDGPGVGKPLLAFIQVVGEGWGVTPAVEALAALPEVEEIHTVTGEACLLLKVRVADSAALEGLLARLYAEPGVRRTSTAVALSTYLERGVQAEITPDLAVSRPGD